MAAQMETRAWRLRLHSPLHVGDQGVGSEVTHAYVPSDTIFSALAVTWRALGGLPPLAELLDEHNPPLLISSAFPFAGDVLLLPRPLLPHTPSAPLVSDPVGDASRAADVSPKRFRRVRWVSQSIFLSLLADPSPSNLDALWGAGRTLQGGAVWVTADEFDALRRLLGSAAGSATGGTTDGAADGADDDLRLWNTSIVPRVTVDRVRSAGQIHHTGRAGFAEGCGLWFLARADRPWLDALERVLAVLGDEGMGGKRSVGGGQFTPELLAPPPSLPQTGGDCVVLLSRTAPRPEQMSLLRHPQAAYDLVLVGGFSGTPGDPPLVRRQVRMVAEGSILGAPPTGEVIGRLVDVTPTAAPSPGHPIWRSGLGFAVRVQLPGAGAAEGAAVNAAVNAAARKGAQ